MHVSPHPPAHRQDTSSPLDTVDTFEQFDNPVDTQNLKPELTSKNSPVGNANSRSPHMFRKMLFVLLRTTPYDLHTSTDEAFLAR
jgi:hypothetical protein